MEKKSSSVLIDYVCEFMQKKSIKNVFRIAILKNLVKKHKKFLLKEEGTLQVILDTLSNCKAETDLEEEFIGSVTNKQAGLEAEVVLGLIEEYHNV